MRRIVSVDTILTRMSTRYSFLIAAGSLAIFGLVTLTVLMGFQSPVPITPVPPLASLTLLYDTLPSANATERVKAIGARPFYILYQSCDPQAEKSGLIDIDVCLKAIESENAGNPPEWGMLDFEEPFTADLQKGADSFECQRALQSMIALVRAVKFKYPNTKWSYYGVPYLPYWIGNYGWSTASDSAKRSALESSIAIYKTLVAELDWISTTIYAKYDPRLFSEDRQDTMLKEGHAWRKAQVGLAVLLGKGKPVIPTACPYWTAGGKADFCRVISLPEFLNDQIVPSVEAGATGFAVWTAIGYFIDKATASPDKIYNNEANFGQKEWRAAFTMDYLNKQTPPDWTNPDIKQRLVSATSDTIATSLISIRDWERSKRDAKNK